MREEKIKSLLSELNPQVLEIENESHTHSGPRVDSHYKVLVVSESFQEQSRLDRQRLVNDLLKSEFEQGLHALSLRCLTPQEAQEAKIEFQSPACTSSNRPAGS